MDELIEKAKNGNSSAFTELILCIKSDLYKIARMRLICEEVYKKETRLLFV